MKKKKSRKFSPKGKKRVKHLISVGNELYPIRDMTITPLEKKKELVEPNFEWIRDIEAFNVVLDMIEKNIGLKAITDSKIVNLENISKFMDDISSGKINNKYDAEKIYTKILENENLLRSCKNFSKNENAETIATIINNLGYAVFGPLLPSRHNADGIENIDIKDMPDLKADEVAEKEPTIGHGLKTMTSSQLMTRLSILLARKQAGNNSQKLKNEIRQIIYSLYRSKNLSKTLYNHLINSI